MNTRNPQPSDDPFFLDELVEHEPVDPAMLPEIERSIAHDRGDDEGLGLRSILERPDALSRLWRRLNAT
ncbi:hypothetical protein [Pendulispora albinea]|uniref:Uncharacterized protein n=1 Tax=Pendulispora albinea TaxID=2741071 RepID=A0ABZ2LYH8_9BACT